LFKLLGDPARFAILGILAGGGEQYVGQLCGSLGLNQPAMSNQLRTLRDTGLVEARRADTHTFYSLASGFEGLSGRVQTALNSIHQAPAKKGRPK
jgi:DNA-binding transcriptional ArsR family regulator